MAAHWFLVGGLIWQLLRKRLRLSFPPPPATLFSHKPWIVEKIGWTEKYPRFLSLILKMWSLYFSKSFQTLVVYPSCQFVDNLLKNLENVYMNINFFLQPDILYNIWNTCTIIFLKLRGIYRVSQSKWVFLLACHRD